MAYMDKEKAESATRHGDHLAKLIAYQGYEKERAAAQAKMYAETEEAMRASAAESARKHKEFMAKHRSFEKTIGKIP